MRTVFFGPDRALRGGVGAALAALLPHLDDVEYVPVGRAPGRPGAPLSDVARAARQVGDVAVFNPSLRPRALVRDLALLAAWRRPAALWIHGGSREAWDGLPSVWVRRVADRALLVVLAQRFGARLIHLGVPSERVRVVPPPYDPTAVARGTGRGTNVLFLGRLTRQKGADLLLEAFARVAPDHPQTRLIFGGTGPLRGWLAERARVLGLGDRVQLAGWLEGPTKRGALESAAVLALPSLDEAVPVSVLEALASGVPIVASDVGAVSETIGKAGIAVAPGDVAALAAALGRVLDSPGERSQRALEGAAAFHPSAVADRWKGILEQLCSS